MIRIDKISVPSKPSNITTDLPKALIGTISPNPTVENTTMLKYSRLPKTFIIPPNFSISPKKPRIEFSYKTPVKPKRNAQQIIIPNAV